MRKLLLGVLFTFISLPVFAQNELSLGADILAPSISAEYKLNSKAAVRMDVGFLIADPSTLSLNPQLLFHKSNNSFEIDNVGLLMPYHGPGLFIQLVDDNSSISAEFVWGFQLDLNDFPIEVFVDAGPSYKMDDPNALSLTSSFGVRYKF